MTGISGKVVAITGASSGIGEATARLLAARGAKVVLGARRSDRLEALVARIRSDGGEADQVVTDVRQRADVTRLVALAVERFGRLDVMLNNAGIAHLSRIDEGRLDDWDAMIDVNLRGTLHGIAAALPVFRQQGAGHIINTLSTSGLKIVPTQGVYAGTKNAVRAISECLRQEAGSKLRVTVISPGFVQSEFVDVLAQSVTDPQLRAGMLARRDEIAIPADAIARAIAFAIEQPPDVDVGEIVVRPTAQD